MKTRIISGLVMAPLLVVLYLGGWWLWAAALLIAVMGLQEFYKGWDNIDVHPSATIGYIMTVLLFVTAVPLSIGEKGAVPQFYENMMVICIWLFLAVATGLIYGWKIDKRGPYDAIATVTGLYFTGYFLGKHKMAPVLSPKKTIEGAVGGLIGSSLLSWVFGLVFMKDMALVCLVLGLVGGAAGMAGDLTASAFKRKMGIKDYGKLIPGHGGIMDRFDSVIFVAPVVYYAICAMTGILSV